MDVALAIAEDTEATTAAHNHITVDISTLYAETGTAKLVDLPEYEQQARDMVPAGEDVTLTGAALPEDRPCVSRARPALVMIRRLPGVYWYTTIRRSNLNLKLTRSHVNVSSFILFLKAKGDIK